MDKCRDVIVVLPPTPLTDALENFLTAYAGFDLKTYTILIAVIFFAVYTFGLKGDFEYIRKKYKDRNIDEDFLNLSSDEFTTKLLSMENTASIIKNRDLSFEAPPIYSDYKSFNGMVYGSFDGSCVDYLYVDFEELPHPEDLSISYNEICRDKIADGHLVKTLHFTFPVIYDGENGAAFIRTYGDKLCQKY